MEQEPANPFNAPTSDFRPLEVDGPVQPKRIIRWRVIPAALLFIVGTPIFLMGLFAMGLAFYYYFTEAPSSIVPLMFFVGVMYLITGSFLVLAGKSTWKARYQSAVIFTVLGLMIPGVAILIAGIG